MLPTVTVWMYLEGIMLNEISRVKNDKYCDFTYGNLKRAEQINKTK